MKITIERKEKAPEVKEFKRGLLYLSDNNTMVMCTNSRGKDESSFEGVNYSNGKLSGWWPKDKFTHFPCEVIIKEL